MRQMTPQGSCVILAKRLVLTAPFAVAAVLTALGITADRLHLHREHIAGYCFLFFAPWAWLLDRGWFFPESYSRFVSAMVDYSVLLWIPAVLYSICFWLLFRAFQSVALRGQQR
jgi:hypothetical protein